MSQLKLLVQRKFWPLFWTQFFGAFNDNFIKNALVIMITFQEATVFGLPYSQIVALSGGIFILPFFLFSALAGQIAEKYNKDAVIRAVKWVEVAIMGLATFGFYYHHFSFLLVVLFLMGTHSTFFGPIKYSILPQHLKPEEIVGGNGLIEAGTFTAILLGTIAGGQLIGGESGPLIVSLGLLLCSLIGLATSYKVPLAPPVDGHLKLKFNIIPPTLEIIRFARQTRSVFLSIMGISWFWFFGAALLSVFPTMGKDLFHGPESLVTAFLAIFCVGIALGSILCAKLSGEYLELGLVPFGSLGLSIFGLIFFVLASQYDSTSPVTAWDFFAGPLGMMLAGDLFFLAMFGGFFIVPLYAMMQERSDIKQRSRIIAANNVINALFMVVSSLMLAGMLALNLSIPVIVLVLSVLNFLVATYIYFLLPEFMLRFLVCIIAQLIYRVRITGAHNIPKEGPAILICNHVSFIDWLIIAAGVRRPARFVMHKSYFEGLFMGPLFRQAKVIPIAGAKEDPAALEAAFSQIQRELRAGELVCIFPEGTITRTGDMAEFRPGILKMLKTTPVPVVPMALGNLWGSLFSRKDKSLLSKRPRRFWSRIHLDIGAPIPAAEVTLERLQDTVMKLKQKP